MLNVPTLLVLGAGASKPFGLPTGEELRVQICRVRNLPLAHEFLDAAGVHDADLDGFLRRFTRSALSIDAFLSQNPGSVDLGKKLIAAFILSAEVSNQLWNCGGHGHSDWYGQLWSRLFVGTNRAEDIGRAPLRIVTFNYDRSLEAFLTTSLVSSYEGVSNERATAIISQIPILHVYGSIGTIGQDGIPYGLETRLNDATPDFRRRLMAMAMNLGIRDLHVMPVERDARAIPEVTEYLRWASRIAFLGFAFDEINCARVGSRLVLPTGANRPDIFMTTLGLTDREVERAKRAALPAVQPLPYTPHEERARCLDAVREWDLFS